MLNESKNIERGVFTPLVFTTTGGIGREATTLYRRLADGISTKERKNSVVKVGSDAISPSESCAQLSLPFTEGDPLATAQFKR